MHCKSNFTFLSGASHPEELVHRAHELGYEALAITDECSVAGVVKAHNAAKETGIKLIVGAEFTIDVEAIDAGVEASFDTESDTESPREISKVHVADCVPEEGALKLVLLAPDRLAYGQLCELITRARRRMPKGEYKLKLADLRWGTDACIVLWIPDNLPIEQLMAQGRAIQTQVNRLWIALELFLDNDDLDRAANALTLSMRLNLPVVASNDVHMHIFERKPLLDTLTAIRLKMPVDQLGTELLSNSERHLRSLETLMSLYPEEMLVEAADIAGSCHFSLDELRYEYPEELVPPGATPASYLRELTFAGAEQRWPKGIPEDVVELIEKELTLVAELNYEYFFLTVHDIVQFARSRGILCQGRGSAANSAVCYCLHITEVDPSRMHLLFERFVSKERDEPPTSTSTSSTSAARRSFNTSTSNTAASVLHLQPLSSPTARAAQ